MVNPSTYFEIPVTDMDRATAFYSAVLGITFERDRVDGYDMALFPHNPAAPGSSGALAKGDVYVPSVNGPIVYFAVKDIDAAIARAQSLGAQVLYAKKQVAPGLHVAEIRDSEGNRMALMQSD